MESKELAFIALMTAILFVLAVAIGQVRAITGIFGINYLLTVFAAIPNVIFFLYFAGKKWRYTTMGIIGFFLIIPTYVYGVPFDMLGKIVYPITVFICDMTFNTLHKYMKKHLLVWSILFINTFYVLGLALSMFKYYLLVHPIVFQVILNMQLVWIPVIIIEATVGAFVALKLHRRIFGAK